MFQYISKNVKLYCQEHSDINSHLQVHILIITVFAELPCSSVGTYSYRICINVQKNKEKFVKIIGTFSQEIINHCLQFSGNVMPDNIWTNG